MIVLETPRLRLREVTLGDAGFVLELLNDPGWLRFIGDRKVRSLADAAAYVRGGPHLSYATHGFGLWLVERKEDGVALGLCGLIKRETLKEVDLGYALLARFTGQGYGSECAFAVVEHARAVVGLARLAAITSLDNAASIRVLERLGLSFRRTIRETPEGEELRYFELEL